MPNIKSAKKRLRQNVVRRARNRAAKSSLRAQIKKLSAAIAAKDVATAETLFVATQKKLDQTAAKKIIHKNAAARVKSRLSAKIKALKGKAA
ncbi:MAG: 30S ribosomal protein S20 [Pirellulales bacterium]|nr:30S ribosomal protein S20 [Pirellulales bacterium]